MPIAADAHGDILLSLWDVGEDELARLALETPCPLSLVVVSSDAGILFGLNRWRRVWELPGGMVEDGESWREAAARELHEETGLSAELRWVGVAEFALTRPERRELAAIYAARMPAGAAPRADDELLDFTWIGAEPPTDTQPLDLAIARWATRDRLTPPSRRCG